MIEAPKIIMRNKMKKLISAILGVLAFGVIQADDHGAGWLVDIDEGVIVLTQTPLYIKNPSCQ